MKNVTNPFQRFELNVTEAGYNCVDSSWRRLATIFPYYRMYYVSGGHALLYLQDRVLDLRPGKLYFIPSFSIFDAHCDGMLEHYWIHFNFDATTEKYLTICRPAYEVDSLPQDEHIFRILVETVKRYQEKNHICDAVACDGLSKYLFSRFLPREKDISSFEGFRFVPVLQYIDENFNRRISNSELSNIMYLSSTYFSNLFTGQFGVSPQQYILQKRLNTAATMLLESSKSVKEIAVSCGFENESYFNRQFHRFTGIPPGKYRKFAFAPDPVAKGTCVNKGTPPP